MTTPNSQPLDIEDAARRALRYLHGLQEFRQVQVLVTGDLALSNYFPGSGVGNNVELLVFLGAGFDDRLDELPSGAPDLLKSRLLSMYPTEFQQPLNVFQIKRIPGIPGESDTPGEPGEPPGIPLRFIPNRILPYVPRGTTTIAAIGQTNAINIPYISSLDLFVFMVISHDMRKKAPKPLKGETPKPPKEKKPKPPKKEKSDEDYARMLQDFLQHLQSIGPVIFSPQQRGSLTHGLNWLTTYGQWSEARWIQELGL